MWSSLTGFMKPSNKTIPIQKWAQTKTIDLSLPCSSAPCSSHSRAHEDGAPCLEDAEAAVNSEPRACSDRGESHPAHRPTVRERRAVEAH